jgi:hypothetical protein
MDRVYNAATYNCAHFVCEVWRGETGRDIDETLHGVLLPPRARRLRLGDVHRVVEVLERPESPCLVLMRNKWESHIGVFLRGRVLHLLQNGVQFQPLPIATLGFNKVRFFRC